MANSPLDFASSEGFRKKLLSRNLTAYGKSPSRPNPPLNYEYKQTDSGVIDSPDNLIDEPIFAKELYKNNQYGAEGGYKPAPDTGALLNSKSNEGEYGFQDARIIDQAEPESKKWKKVNAFGNNSQGVLDSAPFIQSLQVIQDGSGRLRYYDNQPYFTFVPSTYGPVSILLSPDPQGSNGLLSQDSYLARLGATELRKEFERRIATQIRLNTTARINVFNANSGTDILNMITGVVPLIEPNYQITVPANPILAATDFALRLAGSYIPTSPIPGSYWDPSINSGQPTTIQQLRNAFRRTAVGRFFSTLLGSPKTGSQLFLNNTGAGQRSRLFGNLNYNKYKPSYDRGLIERLGGALLGAVTNNSNYYVGSITSEPSRVFSPGGDIPVDPFGKEVQAPVYGPQELAQLYEGPSREIKLGANGPTYSDGGGIEGGFTWVSPKYRDNAGKKVGIGGEITNDDEDFKPSSYNTTESTNFQFREGSILDDTQRIIESQPQGGRRLQHVGNAIDQVSKVFNDGYKELTKGSKVIRYEGAIGQEVGTEYCRVFSKDTPYLQYNDLQKTDGITNQNWRSTYSVFDNTYNLNIAPNSQEGGQDSTNLIGSGNLGYAKKYMFSLENLAWRTSNKPGFTVADLPICERGPNGGRVMWFPPYDLKFSESSSASWRDTNFIGRPEPVYTYSNTNRTGSLIWKIIVDHPSVLNVVVDKVLGNETSNTRANQLLDSFFAGCKKYDLYELAKRYPTISPDELYDIQRSLDYKEITSEQLTYIQNTLVTGVDGGNTNGGGNGQDTNQGSVGSSTTIKGELENMGFYFDNDIPKKGSTVGNYTSYYTTYSSSEATYQKNAPTTSLSNPQKVGTFFSEVLNYNYTKINEQLSLLYSLFQNKQTSMVTIELVGSASAPASIAYNDDLSIRRNDSVIKFIKEFKPGGAQKTLGEIAGSMLVINTDAKGERQTSLTVRYPGRTSEPFNCTDQDGKDKKAPSKEIYTINAMACRRVAIKTINITPVAPVPTQPSTEPGAPTTTTTITEQITEVTNRIPVESEKQVLPQNVSRRVLRYLLSECDYFETVKAETPMVFDNLKQKLKFFNPAFHSMTPEGLNSRLTFLNQCMRPGDTIPVVTKDSNGNTTLKYNDAVNTAFGSPPVLILRVGDFYNTRIIPDSLQISYENLDLNPEGIGVQPMIANITLTFKFVGGQGIKEAVDRIQNALSFNYYANTEIYDDRAYMTDDSEVTRQINEDFANFFGKIPPPTTNQVQNNNGQKNDGFIGDVLTTTNLTDGITGTTSYTKYMGGLSESTQNYFQTFMNKQKEVLAQYNEGVRQIWNYTRLYTTGYLVADTDVTAQLFGKPDQYQQYFDNIFKTFEGDIESDTEDFIKYLKSGSRNFSEKVIRAIKRNYVSFIKNKKTNFLNPLTKIIQDFVLEEQNYVMTLAKLNTITYGRSVAGTPVSGTDGYQQANGFVKYFYTYSSGSTLQDIITDGTKIRTDLNSFSVETETTYNFTNPSDGKNYNNKIVHSKGNEVFLWLGNDPLFEKRPYQRSYVLLSQDVVDDKKYETFKNALIGSVLNDKSIFDGKNMDLSLEFDSYWKGIAKPSYIQQNKVASEFLTFMEKNKLKGYLNYTPYDKNKQRVMEYSNLTGGSENTSPIPENRQKLIKSLGLSNNGNTKTSTWNDKDGSVYITKVKFN